MSGRPGVLVVGGGITGLAAAWQAARGGAAVTLVESEPRVGGKLRTEHVDGLLIEHGPDSFVAYKPAALALLDELGMSGEVIGVSGRRAVHLRADGRLLPLPDGMGMVLPSRLGPFATTPILTRRQKARAGLDLVMPRRLGPDDTSIGAFLRARLGDGVVDRFAQPLIGGIYGAGIDQLSLDAVLPTLRDNERDHRSLMLASLAQGRAARRRSGGATAGSPFRALRGGMATLPGRLAAQLRESGATLQLSTSVAGLLRDGMQTVAALSDGSAVTADQVILAVGPAVLADLLSPDAPAAADALRSIPMGSSTIVTLAFPDSAFDRPPATHGWLEAGPAPISGVTVSSAKWAGRAPAGTVLLRAFVPERLGPLGSQPDEALVPVVTDHVAAVLGARGGPSLVRVARWPGVMPVYTVGHRERVAVVASALAGLPGWHVAGSALHGVGIPECIADGRRAARVALGG